MAFPNIIETVLDTFTDLTGIFIKPEPTFRIWSVNADGTGEAVEILKTAFVLSIDVTEDNLIANHPLENNTVFQDNMVKQPIEVTASLSFKASDYEKAWSTLNNMILTRNTLFIIKYGSRVIVDLVVKSMPSKRDVEKYDIVTLSISFQQFLLPSVKTSKMSDPKNVKVAQYTNREQSGLTKPVTVTAQSLINQASNIIGKIL